MGPVATRTLRGALAGAAAAGVWAAQQPLDKQVFGSDYDDVELLGKFVTTESSWLPIGLAMHLQNGALFGAAYANVAASLPVPAPTRGPLAGIGEHLATWPAGRIVDRVHPARRQIPGLAGNRRAFWQSFWRHALFGFVLGELERRLNRDDEPPQADLDAVVASNGHGSLEDAVLVRP